MNAGADTDDDVLMLAWAAGDAASFELLYARHRGSLYRFLLRQLRDPALADEFFQDEWQRVIAARQGWKPEAAFRTWLFRIVVNRAISTGLHERRHLPVGDDELEDDSGRFSKDGWWVTPPAHWADEAIDRITAPELAARIRQLIDDLPPGQRQVVTLRDVEGLSSADVQEILGISQANQRVLLHRGRARLRRELEREVLL